MEGAEEETRGSRGKERTTLVDPEGLPASGKDRRRFTLKMGAGNNWGASLQQGVKIRAGGKRKGVHPSVRTDGKSNGSQLRSERKKKGKSVRGGGGGYGLPGSEGRT